MLRWGFKVMEPAVDDRDDAQARAKLAGPAPMNRVPRVLVVEDEQDIAGLIKHALERSGDARVEIVGSGDAALRAVTEQTPDLVILDLNLPVLSGTEVCRILRGRPTTANVPIIMLTARTGEADRVTGLDLGADDYVTKPFSLRELARPRARGAAPPPGGRRIGANVYTRLASHRRLRCGRDRGRRRGRAADAARVRAAQVPGGEPQPRAVARPAARARLGLRPLHRDALGRRARRPPAGEARRRRPANRNGRRTGLPVRRIDVAIQGERTTGAPAVASGV